MIKYIHEVVTKGDCAVGFALVWHASSVWNVAVKKVVELASCIEDGACLGREEERGWDGGVKGRYGVGYGAPLDGLVYGLVHGHSFGRGRLL